MPKLAHVQAALQPSEPDPLDLLSEKFDAIALRQSEAMAKLARGLLAQFGDLSERIAALENRKAPDYAREFGALKADVRAVQNAVAAIEMPVIPEFPKPIVPRETNLAPVLEAIKRIKVPKMESQPLREYDMKVEYDQWGDVTGARFVQLK